MKRHLIKAALAARRIIRLGFLSWAVLLRCPRWQT